MLLALVVRADTPFYTSKKLGLLVRQPPNWKIADGDALVMTEPGGTVRVRFEVVTGQNASALWKRQAEALGKSHGDFRIMEQLLDTPRACLAQASFKEGDAAWIGTYTVKSLGPRLLFASSESKVGADKKLLEWASSIVEPATPTR